ncbi:tetratricopeptide repeat protein [Streptomyces sp. NPDC091287]|uniref:tetratricopeptide repeat protein n=1 Tax=Streptomyces sp. NPDC091287 TaxID=3365988 RepID=UPI0038038C14
MTRRQDAVAYEELRTIADAFTEDERARTVLAPRRRAPDAATNSNTVSGGTFREPVVQAGTFNGGVHTYYGSPQHPGLPPVAEWPRLDAADPIAFGVRRTRRIGDEPPLPPYVARDGDAVLKERVRTAAETGGLVLVTGEPLSGKSRTAWAGMLTNLPGTTRVLAPAIGTDLRGLPAVLRGRGGERCVIWLDDLEGHLGEHGLSPALLADLVGLRVPVIATMSDEAYDAHRFGGQARARVLAGVDPVELSSDWTEPELLRLEAGYGDARLHDAGTWCDGARVTEYLAVAPELWDEWWRARRLNAHPHGHLLVRAAIDFARCGTDDVPIPLAVLRKACALYEQEGARAAGESFEDALEWVTAIRHGVAGMLVPGEAPDTWRVHSSLFSEAETRPGTPPVPLGLWLLAGEAMREAPPYLGAVLATAENALVREAGEDPEVALLLGHLHEATGQAEDAEKWYRRSADAGNVEAAGIVGRALAARGETAEAIPYLERAAEAGYTDARGHLVTVLVDRAVFWLDRSAEDGSPTAADYARRLRESVSLPPDNVIVEHFQRRLQEALDTSPDNVKE